MSPPNIERADRHLVLADAYAGAARLMLAGEIAGELRLPYFALVAHGLELALKAILIGNGRDEEDMILIGHDLARAREAVARSQPALVDAGAPHFVAIVDALSYPHAVQCFRYPQRLPEDLPDPASALDALRNFLETAKAQVGRNRRAQGAT